MLYIGYIGLIITGIILIWVFKDSQTNNSLLLYVLASIIGLSSICFIHLHNKINNTYKYVYINRLPLYVERHRAVEYNDDAFTDDINKQIVVFNKALKKVKANKWIVSYVDSDVITADTIPYIDKNKVFWE